MCFDMDNLTELLPCDYTSRRIFSLARSDYTGTQANVAYSLKGSIDELISNLRAHIDLISSFSRFSSAHHQGQAAASDWGGMKFITGLVSDQGSRWHPTVRRSTKCKSEERRIRGPNMHLSIAENI